MEHYSVLRLLADSWMLVALFVAFIVAVLFVWRPGSRRQQDDAARSIFRNEGHPAPDPHRGAGRDATDSHATDSHKTDLHEGK